MIRYSFDTNGFVIKKHIQEETFFAIRKDIWRNTLEWISVDNPKGEKNFPEIVGCKLKFNEQSQAFEIINKPNKINFDDLEWTWRDVYNCTGSRSIINI
jgi:hypothetical protein